MRVLLAITDSPHYEWTGYGRAWADALERQGCTVERLAGVPAEWAVGGLPAPEWDFAVAHVLVEEVAAFSPVMALASLLETAGVPLLNPLGAIVASADKLVTHAVWAAGGLPQPATFALDALDAWPGGSGPMVIKPALGDGARHLGVVSSLAEARRVQAAWREDEQAGGERRGRALVQQWIREPACVRIFATPHETSLAYEKSREPGELVTQGTVYPRVYPPPRAMAALARRMVAALGGGLMGVDVLRDGDGALWALEANAPFGFDVTDPAQGDFVAAAAIRAMRRRTGTGRPGAAAGVVAA